MPAVKNSPALKKAEEAKLQRERIIKIISAATVSCGLDRYSLARKADLNYDLLSRRLRGETDFRSQELCAIADALRLDVSCRAAILGAKEKCRYEPGYKERRETSIG